MGRARSQRLVSDRVVEQARTLAAPLFADSEGKETFLTRPLLILDGMAGVPVVCRRVSSKIRRQRAAFTSQPLLLGGELECTSWVSVGNPDRSPRWASPRRCAD